jgi:acyl carrier protein
VGPRRGAELAPRQRRCASRAAGARAARCRGDWKLAPADPPCDGAASSGTESTVERDQILEQLRAIMARSAATARDWQQVTEQDAIASLGIDSLAMLDFIYDLQQEFGIDFEPTKLMQVQTVGQLATFLLERTGG